MAKTTFILKEPRSLNDTLIFLVFRYGEKRVKISTNQKICPKYWSKAEHRARETKQFPQYPEFNARLKNIENDAMEVFMKYQNEHDHQQPTVEVLRELLNQKLNPTTIDTEKDFFSFAEKFVKEAETRINDKTGKVFSTSTIQVYNRCLELLREYSKKKKKRIDFDTIDLDFYHDFTAYLNKEYKFSTNSIGKQIKIVKTFLNDATERGVNTNLSFKSKRFRVTTEKSENIYLTEKELEEIFDKDLSDNKKLDRVRDLFLVGCWTGLRFSDFTNIKPENIKGDYIEIETKKTAEPVVIPIHSTVKKIMAKYNGQYENSLPPAISNAKMNEYLKDLGKLIDCLKIPVSTGITKGGLYVATNKPKHDLITTHTARRSFASNLFVEGFPSATIMKITGHRTEKAFMSYIKITPTENAKILQLHWQNKQLLKAV